jgi:hypothetical protein
MGSSLTGTMSAYETYCAGQGLSVLSNGYPGSCGGAVFNSNSQSCSLYVTAQNFFNNVMVPAFPAADYNNILLLHGSSSNCWAHDAEGGSMHAFGGPSGSGYSFCRGGGSAAKQYHIYVCQ